MRKGDGVWIHRPEGKYRWRIMSDTETSLRFHLKDGNVLTSCGTIGHYAQPCCVSHIQLKFEQIHSFRHRQVLNIPRRIAVREKWVPFIRKGAWDSKPERVEVLTWRSSVYRTSGILTLADCTDAPNQTP